nr:nitronate monooxygenase [Nocardia wallacei]
MCRSCGRVWAVASRAAHSRSGRGARTVGGGEPADALRASRPRTGLSRDQCRHRRARFRGNAALVATAADTRTALAAGAAGVVAGTRFLLTEESGAHREYQRRVLAARETVETTLFGLGWPARHRVVPNAATRRWCGSDGTARHWVRALNTGSGVFGRLAPEGTEAVLLAGTASGVAVVRPGRAAGRYAGFVDGPRSMRGSRRCVSQRSCRRSGLLPNWPEVDGGVIGQGGLLRRTRRPDLHGSARLPGCCQMS